MTRSLARGAVAGLLGGALAGLADAALSTGDAARFLPTGAWRLGLFLVTLYAALGALAGAATGLAAALLGWATDLGLIARARLDGSALANTDSRSDSSTEAAHSASTSGPPGEREGARLLAYLVALVPAFALHALAIGEVTRFSLARFHAHLPIAALVGAASAGLGVAGVLLVFLVAAALSPLVRFGPRLRPRLAAPLGWMAAFWLGGLGAATVSVLLLVDALQLRPRMRAPAIALNAEIWAPVVTALAFVALHVAGRAAWSIVRRRSGAASLGRLLAQPFFALLLVAALAALGAAGALAATWSTAKLIAWGPVAVAAIALLATGLFAALGPTPSLRRRIDALRPSLRVLTALAVPLLLLAAARSVGRRDRVRKAAFAARLAPSLLTAIQQAWDLDRDHYPSTLALGTDCDDRDPTVHPGAFDWPDDGVDQNCNGHEATAQTPPRPPFPAVPPSVPERPNVVLITIDALRADHVSAYGYSRPTTPHLDALAKDGVLFQNGWAHSPSTRYSVPAILIGRYESTIAWDPRAHWPPLVLPENRLMSEMFHERGWQTAALTPSHYFEPGWGLIQGFGTYDNSLSRLHGNPFHGDPARTTGSSSRELADLGIQWLDAHAVARAPTDGQAPSQEPFFLWMHFYDPHYLYERHPDCAPCQFPGSEKGDDVALYDGEVRFTDEHIGRVLDELKRLGLWDETIVVVTADHGEGFGEHGVKQHGYNIYAQQNKVPFIVRVPGIAPRTVEEPVGHVDLFPSLLNLTRGKDEPQLLGRSFVDLMTGVPTEPRRVFGEVEYEGPVVRKSVVTKDWHLIQNVVPDDTFELYHLVDDPQEEHDLAGLGLDEESSLRLALATWMDESALPPHFAERVSGNLSSKEIAPQRRLDARLGDLLAVDGVDVTAPKIARGGAVDVALVLHALQPIPSGWHLFTHVVAPSGGRFLNADHEPVEGFVPIAKLKPGQWVRDRIHVALPPDWPAGPLTVEIGLFKGGQRAPASTAKGPAGDKIVAATVEVE